MKKDMVTGLSAIILGLLYTYKALSLPKASIGNPMAPLYFPLSLGVLMVLMGVIGILTEMGKKINLEDKKEIKEEKDKSYVKLIAGTVIASIIYTVLFDKIGFIISTVLFLSFILFMVNGKDKWITNILVSVLFSFSVWYVFEKLINISLP
ncbi:tripartite tricarboxylate transporter TctB family protein [Thermovenabulum sp.]|uniref:tripartite tricarboxylate transporter TctB family protein n=1 Tax=Thermovenabulum sp. TaxID=3100335 RepID=UPI003C7C2AC0